MEYKATFGIDHCISHGFASKKSTYSRETLPICANNSEEAYKEAMTQATRFADDYLTNPKTDKTTVQLLSLEGPEGRLFFDASKSIVERTTLDHLLKIALESHSQ